jgi:subtilase family protein
MVANAQEKKEEHRLDFFRPDQIVFLVTHNPVAEEHVGIEPQLDMQLKDWVVKLNEQLNIDEQLLNRQLKDFIAACNEQLNNDEEIPYSQLQAWIDGLEKRLDPQGWKLVEPQPRSYSFPAVDSAEIENVPGEYRSEKFDGAFSIIVCNVEKQNLPPDVDKNQNSYRDESRLGVLDLISTLEAKEERAQLDSAELTVQGIFPNWVTSGGKSDSGGTGGPGSEPVPYEDPSGPVPYFFQDLISRLQGIGSDGVIGKDLYGRGSDVDVVILDTAPCGHDLVLAHKELVVRQEDSKKHPLIKTLLGPGGRLKLYPATYEELLRMGNTSLNKHGYKMDDHGLFIAGIIHSIVPEATIHLIEVLNQFGVGDIETIARGFAKAYSIARRNKRPLVVNCSIVLDLPQKQKARIYRQTDKETIRAVDRDLEEKLRSSIESEWTQLEAQYGPVRATDDLGWVRLLLVMCERLAKAGRQVVAASGNDSEEKQGHRHAQDARYPAAFSRVIGVGALPKNARRNNGKYRASSFSNLADKPAQTGVLTLGGEPGEYNGVLGIYLGEFPVDDTAAGQNNEQGWAGAGRPSANGWGWWAGTSFATPILTGVIASLLSGNELPKTTQHAIQALYTEHVIENAMTDEKEDVLSSSMVQTVNPAELPA